MAYTLPQLLSFEEFLAQYGNNPRYELADGELIDMEPTGPHETVAGKVASKLNIELERQRHPWFIPRTCIVRPFADVATARRPDVVVLDETVK
jgi:Uma2 family endonuclease